MALKQVAGRVEGVGVGDARCRLVALRQTRRPPAVGAEQGACAIEFGDDMPAVVEEVVARGGVGGLLLCPQTVGTIARSEGGIGASPVVQLYKVELPCSNHQKM